MFTDILYIATDYCEQPRRGIADFNGVPHYFVSLFDNERDDWSEVCMLFPVDHKLFDAALLGWAIERRFLVNMISQDLPYFRLNAMPDEKQRYHNILHYIDSKAVVKPELAILANAKFVMMDPKISFNLAFVEWTKLPQAERLHIFHDRTTWKFKKAAANNAHNTEGDLF